MAEMTTWILRGHSAQIPVAPSEGVRWLVALGCLWSEHPRVCEGLQVLALRAYPASAQGSAPLPTGSQMGRLGGDITPPCFQKSLPFVLI